MLEILLLKELQEVVDGICGSGVGQKETLVTSL